MPRSQPKRHFIPRLTLIPFSLQAKISVYGPSSVLNQPPIFHDFALDFYHHLALLDYKFLWGKTIFYFIQCGNPASDSRIQFIVIESTVRELLSRKPRGHDDSLPGRTRESSGRNRACITAIMALLKVAIFLYSLFVLCYMWWKKREYYPFLNFEFLGLLKFVLCRIGESGKMNGPSPIPTSQRHLCLYVFVYNL